MANLTDKKVCQFGLFRIRPWSGALVFVNTTNKEKNMSPRSSRRFDCGLFLLIICISAINVVIGLIGTTADKANAQTQVGTIFFRRCTAADCDIYRIRSDGSGESHFYGSNAFDHEPHVSPDGTKVLFYQIYPPAYTNADIFTIDISGDVASLTRLTSSSQREVHPSWSPDGSEIAYMSGIPGRPWIMNADGSNQRQLVSGGESHGVEFGSDGYIYFMTYGFQTPTYDIYRVDRNGDNLELLIRTDDASEGHPILSPDGTQLLFARIPSTGSNAQICASPPCYWNIWVKDLQSGVETQLTNSLAHNLGPVWSPDGSSIAYTSDVDGDYEIYVMDADGANIRQITDNSIDDEWPFWSGGSAPVAIDDSYQATEDLSLTLIAPGVLANDSDASGDELFVNNITQPNNGVVTINLDGSFTYVPQADYCGQDSFTYIAGNGQAVSNEATVELDVNCVNDPPVGEVDIPSITIDEGLLAANSGSFYDVEGDPVTLSASLGTVTVESGSGNATESLVYENDFLDLEGWTSPGIIGNRCNYPIQQRDSVVYNSGGNRSSHVALPQTIITEEAQPFAVEVKFRYRDDGGMYIGLMKENANPCEAWANNGFVFTTGGERQDAYALIWPEGGNYEILRILKAHDGLWHIVRMEGDVDGIWSLYIDDELIGTSIVPDFDTNYKYLSVDSYTGSGVNEFDWIKVYVQEPDRRWIWDYLTTDGPSESQPVTVFADDGNGGVGEGKFDLTVKNVAPTGALNANANEINEGSAVTVTFSDEYDPSSADTSAGFRYSFDCTDDGAFEATDVLDSAYACQYGDDGTYTIRGRIKDKDGGFSDYTTSVIVNNIAPTVAMSGSPTATEGHKLTYSFTISDPG